MELFEKTNVKTKKFMCSIGMNYERIHACPNDCILYQKNYEGLKSCPVYDADQYKKKIPSKILWYFLIIFRFKHIFRSAGHAKSLMWHSDGKISDNMLWHLADSLKRQMVDSKYPIFGDDARNLLLGLSPNGMNPYGNTSSTQSTWLVVLIIYNLSP